MRSRRIFVAMCLALSPMTVARVNAQDRCGTMENLEEQTRANPRIAFQLVESEVALQRASADLRRSPDAAFVYTIPVVVHVVYATDAENIPDERVLTQLAVLNEDYRRLPGTNGFNPDRSSSDSQVHFQLAQFTPKGDNTTGIVRRRTDRQFFVKANEGVKYTSRGGSDAWDTTRYLNVWVCNLREQPLGYAQFPGTGTAETDGVVIDYRCFGRQSENARYNLGRTATHEIGHYLSLWHTFSHVADQCTDADHVQDTPPCHGPNYGNNAGVMCCGSRRMVENYLDYTDDQFMNLFTRGQVARIHACLDGLRAELFSNPPLRTALMPIRVEGPTGDSTTLLVGLDDAASDSLDASLGEARLGPQDPTIPFSAWLEQPSANVEAAQRRTLTDIRRPAGEVQWRIKLVDAQGAAAASRVNLSWDVSQLRAGDLVLSYGQEPSVNMRVVRRVTIPASSGEVRVTLRTSDLERQGQAIAELREMIAGLERSNRELRQQVDQAEAIASTRVATELERLTRDNADLQRRLQETVEVRRLLEVLEQENGTLKRRLEEVQQRLERGNR